MSSSLLPKHYHRHQSSSSSSSSKKAKCHRHHHCVFVHVRGSVEVDGGGPLMRRSGAEGAFPTALRRFSRSDVAAKCPGDRNAQSSNPSLFTTPPVPFLAWSNNQPLLPLVSSAAPVEYREEGHRPRRRPRLHRRLVSSVFPNT